MELPLRIPPRWLDGAFGRNRHVKTIFRVLFLPLFVFLPKLIQRAMKADADVVIEVLGKNERVKKVFWTFFIAMAGLMLVRVVDPVTALQVFKNDYGIGDVNCRSLLKYHQYPDQFFKLIAGSLVSPFWQGNFEPYSLPRFTVITTHNTWNRYT